MSRAQVTPNLFGSITSVERRIGALERTVNAPKVPIVDTTGLSSDQIDAIIFGGQQQPYDGAQAADSVNKLFLVRAAGKWCSRSLATIP